MKFGLGVPQHDLPELMRQRQEHALSMHGDVFVSKEYHVAVHLESQRAIKILRGERPQGLMSMGIHIGHIMLVAHEHEDGEY